MHIIDQTLLLLWQNCTIVHPVKSCIKKAKFERALTGIYFATEWRKERLGA